MDSKDILDISMKMADLASKVLQFLILGTVAVVGWILTGKGLASTAIASSDRMVFALIFALFYVGLWATYSRLIIRVQAGLKVAHENSEDGLKNSPQFKVLTAPFETWATIWILPIIGLGVCGLIIFWVSVV